MAKKIVIKVAIVATKDKTYLVRIVSEVRGINSVAVDEEKGTLTVIGDVDPAVIVKTLRKHCMKAEIDTVANDEPPEPKCPVQEPKPCDYYWPPVVVPYYDCDTGGCTIQ